MIKYIKQSISKFKADALSKLIYDFIKNTLILVLLFIGSKYIPKDFSISKFLFYKFEISVISSVLFCLALIIISSALIRLHFIKKYRNLHNLHFTDELTGLKNSNGLKSFLENLISNESIKTHPVSLVLIDIDDFNKLNLELGYSNADKILAKVGEYLKGDSRSTDKTFRYHQKGDEFLVVLTKTTQSEAKTAAERKRKDIEELLIQLETKTYSVKVSCGITELKKIDSVESLLLRTENALMEAKRQPGKNCTKTII